MTFFQILRVLLGNLLLGVALFGASEARAVSVTNCGLSHTYETPPERAITLNQHATELMLALGLESRIIGTAYIDDDIAPQYKATYDQIPVLAKKYPSREVILASGTDFVFAGFKSAFGKQVAGERPSLQQRGIGSFLVSSECLADGKHPDLSLLYQDIRQLGEIFAVQNRAAILIAQLKTRAKPLAERFTGALPKALLFDSGDKTAFSAACCGTASALMRLAGIDNIGGALAGNWANLSWEAVVEADPDVIVLIDADWSSSDAKRRFLLSHPVLSQLRAVREAWLVSVPFSATVFGIHFIDNAVTLRRQVGNLLAEN
ncbi:MAG: ABC transporter substrate-binding protein [Pseudomonadota bacterium]